MGICQYSGKFFLLVIISMSLFLTASKLKVGDVQTPVIVNLIVNLVVA